MILSLMFFDMAFWFYLAASVFYIGYWVLKREWVGSTGTVLVIVAFVANTMSMVYRTIETDHMPWANLYESMTLFIFITTIAYLYLEFRHKMKVIGAFIVPIIFIATFAAALLSNSNTRTRSRSTLLFRVSGSSSTSSRHLSVMRVLALPLVSALYTS